MAKTVRKLLCLLLIMLMICGTFSGCGQKPADEPAVEAEQTAEVTPEDKEESSDEPVTYTIDNIRDYVVGVEEPMELSDGTMRPLINFDNAATTPPLKPVMDAVDREMNMYGSIGRGFSQKSNHSTDLYNDTREVVLDFVGADPNIYTCFYVNTTTDGLNKLASALVESEDDLVLATRIEHHANDLP